MYKILYKIGNGYKIHECHNSKLHDSLVSLMTNGHKIIQIEFELQPGEKPQTINELPELFGGLNLDAMFEGRKS